ncbi:hypothetical protein E7744_02535 [Citricoccus sp. SGAir0253]|uniref:hypothetical protein n=1 Tax=Citricoccus sp. SGAir0253 TaxID=2567881 RepID=UPI0010CD6834|nr:hypothetical protein [Citricoccus sp. SGAir0253]QCU77217.1 hypothetical protein E7744_02535 [Citricoccus sp. SGAir0253]
MARYEDELEQQFIEEPENDLEEPADGRDGTVDFGSSDDPDTLDAIDPLKRDTFLLDGDEDYNGIPDYQEGREDSTGEDDPDEDGDWASEDDEDLDEDERG